MPDAADEKGAPVGKISPVDRDAFRKRSSDLDRRIGEARGEPVEERGGRAGADRRAMSYGFRMVADFVSAIIVGGVIGYFADYILGTSPWMLVGFLVLGFIAGVRNVMGSYNRMQADMRAATGGDIGRDMPDSAYDDD
ncbi:MAG: AtpZ/AtpI family protein [Pseudomonadota bacterium]